MAATPVSRPYRRGPPGRQPLIIHTLVAADTLRVLREEKPRGGRHLPASPKTWRRRGRCWTWASDLVLGIVTFKNALALKEVARAVPLDRLLVETDAPYLAPVPFRGKINQPAYVRHVAEEVARLRNLSFEQLAEATTANFFRLFSTAKPAHV
jgi:TatD DNase family protein